MRKAVWAALALSWTMAQAEAGQVKFSPDTFKIYGGMGNEQVAALAPAKPGKKLLHRQMVDFDRQMAPGSILVSTEQRRLYFVLPGGKAIMYPVGVGREGFTWSGTNRITRKAVWPDWRPPQVMIEREAAKGHFIPAFMPGGPENPLGARAMYIGNTEFRIHGTTQPWSIGQAVSSGCIRMMNDEVIDLFDRVKVGATVVVE